MEKGWHEVLITAGPDPAAPTILKSDGTSASSSISRSFRPVLSSEPSPAAMILGMSSPRFQQLPVGSQIEVSPASFKAAHQIGELFKPSPEGDSTGCALIVDYGGDKVFSDSFRVRSFLLWVSLSLCGLLNNEKTGVQESQNC